MAKHRSTPEKEQETPPVNDDMGPEYDRTTWATTDEESSTTAAPTTKPPQRLPG